MRSLAADPYRHALRAGQDRAPVARPTRPGRVVLALLGALAACPAIALGQDAGAAGRPLPPIPAEVQDELEPPQGNTSIFEHGSVQGVLVLPEGAGREPTGIVVVLHDELGPDPRSRPYVDQLIGARVAVLDMQRMDRDTASFAMVAAGLAADPRTRELRIGVLGFGGGGGAASRIEGPIAARALLYPGCQGLALPPGAPSQAVFLAHGDADAANTTGACAEAASRLAGAGLAVRHRVYRGAGYAWDHPIYGMEQRILVPHPDGAGRVAIAPWPDLTDLAASQVAAFFSAAFQAAP